MTRTLFRRWLARLPRFDIGDGQGDVFFSRYDLVKNRWFAIYLHEFFRSDNARCLHDHPWNFLSLILWGGYWEEMTTGLHWRRPGSILFRRAETAHRIVLDGSRKRVWSLVVVGRKHRPWGFYSVRGWLPWVAGEPNPVCETEVPAS